MKTSTYVPNYMPPPRLPTPGELARAEALRRGGHYAQNADHYAALAERWYGRSPLHGEDLRVMLDDVLADR